MEAIRSYERVATIQPTNVAIRNRLGWLYLQEREAATALKAFQGVLESVESGADARERGFSRGYGRSA